MLSQLFCFSLNEYKPIERMLHIPNEWRKLDVTVVCDGTGLACRHKVVLEEVFPFEEVHLGQITLTDKTVWTNLDRLVVKKFKRFLKKTLPYRNLGLTSSAIMNYNVGVEKRDMRDPYLPSKAPLQYAVNGHAKLRIFLKGAKQQGSVDALVFQTQLYKEAINVHVRLLLRRGLIILHSSQYLQSFLDVSFVVRRIAEFVDNLPSLNRRRLTLNEVTVFTCNGQRDNVIELRDFINLMAMKSNQAETRKEALRRDAMYIQPVSIPNVVVVENLEKLSTDLTEILDGFIHYRKRVMGIPYLLGTFLT